MKLTALLLFLLFQQPPLLPFGATIPKADFKIKDVDGSLTSLREIATAKGLLVVFGANNCPYVSKNQSRLKTVCALAREKGLGVVVLNSNEDGRNNGESLEDMQVYAQQQGYTWSYALDSDATLADAFGARRMPECFLFDKNHKLVYRGAIDDSPADPAQVKHTSLKQAITDVVQGNAIAIKEARVVGCSIRRRGM